MALAIVAIWLVLAVIVAVFFAAVGRSASREDRALGHVTDSEGPGRPDADEESPVAAAHDADQPRTR